jgi:hypothetical protein
MTAAQRIVGSHGQGTAGLDLRQLAILLRAPMADLYRACELGLLPGPGPDGRWPVDATAQIVCGWPQTAAAVEAARDLGAVRSADLLARLTGLPVTAAHLAELAARGLLTSPRSYKNRPLYRISDLHALAADPAVLGQLTEITTPAGRRR